MPVGEVSNIDDSAVVVSLVQDLADIDWEKCCNDRLKMRLAIGEEFFVPISAAGPSSGVEVLGFFRGMYKLIQSEVGRAIQPNASVPPNY